MDLIRAYRQLDVIRWVVDTAARLSVQVWLRGGWAMDFHLGEITRDHVDVDWFAWRDDADRLGAALVADGWTEQPGPPADQQRDVVRDDLELSFALLARDADGQVVVGGGPWAGTPWPAGMLDAPPGRIGELTCPIISVAAQIEIKTMMPVWVPGMPRRPKDALDVQRLRRVR